MSHICMYFLKGGKPSSFFSWLHKKKIPARLCFQITASGDVERGAIFSFGHPNIQPSFPRRGFMPFTERIPVSYEAANALIFALKNQDRMQDHKKVLMLFKNFVEFYNVSVSTQVRNLFWEELSYGKS